MTNECSRREFLIRSAGAAALPGAAVVLLEACTGSSGTPGGQASPARGGGAAYVLPSEPDTLFAPTAKSATANFILSFTANGLTRLQQPQMEPVGDLAASWQVSSDQRTYTFKLHPMVRWQDGTPLTAADAKFTQELLSHPEWPGPLAPTQSIIEGAAEFKKGQAKEISGIEAVDDTTLRITLTGPSALFLSTTATAVVLPKHLLADIPPGQVSKSPFARKPVYSGPYSVTDWKSGEAVDFKAFAGCFAGRPLLDTLEQRVVPATTAAVSAIRAGEVQMTFVPVDLFETFKNNPSYRTMELSGAAGWFIAFDTTNPLFSDVRVRQAVYHAIDRRTIVDTLYRGKAELTDSIVSPLEWVYNPGVTRYGYDPGKSAALLDAAGWKQGAGGVREKDGRPLRFTMMTIANQTKDMAVAVQPYLAKVGVQFDIDDLELGTLVSRMHAGGYEAAVTGWYNFLYDPRQDIQAHFVNPKAVDYNGYDSPLVQRLYQEGVATTDRTKAREIWGQILDQVAKDCVYAYLWRPKDLVVSSASLSVSDVQVRNQLFSAAPRWHLTT